MATFSWASLFHRLVHHLFFSLWCSDGKEIMAKGPLDETNQPAKSHKSTEGILKNNYKETVSIRTEEGAEQVHVCVGCSRVSSQGDMGVQQGWFQPARWSPNQALESDLSQEKVAELQVRLQEHGWRGGHSCDVSDYRKCWVSGETLPHTCAHPEQWGAVCSSGTSTQLSPAAHWTFPQSSSPAKHHQLLCFPFHVDSMIHTSWEGWGATNFSPTSNAHHEELQHCWQLQATHPVLK